LAVERKCYYCRNCETKKDCVHFELAMYGWDRKEDIDMEEDTDLECSREIPLDLMIPESFWNRE